MPRRCWREVLGHPAWSAPFCNRQALHGDDDFRSLCRLSRAPLCPPFPRGAPLVGDQDTVMIGVHPLEPLFGGAARALDIVVAGDVATARPSRRSRCCRRRRGGGLWDRRSGHERSKEDHEKNGAHLRTPPLVRAAYQRMSVTEPRIAGQRLLFAYSYGTDTPRLRG